MQDQQYATKASSGIMSRLKFQEHQAQLDAQPQQALAGTPPVRQREVEEWMNRLYTNLGKLESLTSAHIERLGFVSRQNAVGETKESVPESSLVPLANSLRSVSQRIERLMVQISDATDNLEIP